MLCRKNKQDVAQSLSADINEAYQCLLKPLSRAEYILNRHHISVSETDQVDDLEFMSEIMEIREAIDDAENADEVIAITDENRGMPTLSRLHSFGVNLFRFDSQHTEDHR